MSYAFLPDEDTAHVLAARHETLMTQAAHATLLVARSTEVHTRARLDAAHLAVAAGLDDRVAMSDLRELDADLAVAVIAHQDAVRACQRSAQILLAALNSVPSPSPSPVNDRRVV